MGLVIELFKMCYKKETEYRLNFILLCIAVAPLRIVQMILAWFVAVKIEGFTEWSSTDMVFLYALFMTSYSIAQVFFRHFRFLDRMIIEGTLDQYLLKPQPVLFSLIFYNVHIMEIVSQLLPSFLILLVTCVFANIHWNVYRLIVLIQALIGGSVIQAGIFIIMGCLSFTTLKSNWAGQLYYAFRDYMCFPVSIFGKKVLLFLTYFFPLAFINYYPARYILSVEDPDSILNFLTLFVGAIVGCSTYFIWKKSIRTYTGTGS